jgi:hypothetical protein
MCAPAIILASFSCLSVVCYYPQDMGALSSFTFGAKQAVTMTTEMTDANFSGKLNPHEAQIVAAFLPKCT